MITVHIPNDFIAERTYAVRTLLSHYCGVQVEIETDDRISAYEIRWAEKSIIVADAFFGKITTGQDYIDPAYLPEKPAECIALGLDQIIRLYGEEHLEIHRDSIHCGIDLFAGLFFMLTRWEEALPAEKDLHARFPASAAAIVKAGYILRPVVDEYATLMRGWLLALGYPVPEDRTEYTVVPSCDVDMPYYWQSKPLWKSLGGRLLKHWNVLESVEDYREYKNTTSGTSKDPFDTFDYLMTLAEQHETRFQFNFIGGGKTKFEGYYPVNDPFITSLITSIKSRGHKIGLHPSYDAYTDAKMIAMEKQAVEEAAGMSITSSRQHYLRFSLPETWSALAQAGITEDSTMGYAAEPGFRCGTCKPFHVFDIHKREQLDLIERPLLIMDVSLRMYKQLSVEESIVLSDKIKAQVKKHNGELVILWHNSSLSKIDGWEGWNWVLERLFT